MIGFHPTTEVSEDYRNPALPFPKPPTITIRANTTTELDHEMKVTYVDGVGNATVTAYQRTGTDVLFGSETGLIEIYIFPTDQTEMDIRLGILNDHIAEFNEFLRLNITLTTTNESSPATCQSGDAEQYRCSTDIFILDDDCKSCHLSVWIIFSTVHCFCSAPFEIGFEKEQYTVSEAEGVVSVCVIFIVPGESEDAGIGDREVDIYIFSTTSLKLPAASKLKKYVFWCVLSMYCVYYNIILAVVNTAQ